MSPERDFNTGDPQDIDLYRERLQQVLGAFVEGSLPNGLWAPAEQLLEHLGAGIPEMDVPRELTSEVRGALARLRGADRSRLPMAASSASAASAAELVVQGQAVGVAYGVAVDVDGEGELVQVEVREVEVRPAERSRATINTYGPLARVVAIDGGIVANSQFTDSIRRVERLLEKNLPGREIHVECEVAYCRGSEPSRRRTIEGSSLSGAVVLAVLSKLYDRPVQRNLAVSFSVNSDGSIGPVDQAGDKARVARRNGIDQLVLPSANIADVARVPAQLVPNEILYIQHLDELWVPTSAPGAVLATPALLRGFFGNLRHRSSLASQLGTDRRFPSIVIGSGPNRGDTTFLR